MSHMIRVSSTLFIPSFNANGDSKPKVSVRSCGREHAIKSNQVDATFRSFKNPCAIYIKAASNIEWDEIEFDRFQAKD